MHAAAQLTATARRGEQLDTFRKLRPVRHGLRRSDAEPLPRQCVPIFQPREAYVDRSDTGEAGELPGEPLGVRRAFLEPEPRVLAFALGLEAQDFLDEEVLRPAADSGGKQRRAMGPGIQRKALAGWRPSQVSERCSNWFTRDFFGLV